MLIRHIGKQDILPLRNIRNNRQQKQALNLWISDHQDLVITLEDQNYLILMIEL